jgi:glycosyltransferase involved in cell wall biosynthesis
VTLRPLCIAPFGEYGGSEMVLMRVLRALGPTIEPSLAVLTPGRFAEMLEEEGFPVQVEDLPGKQGVLQFRRVARELADRYRGEVSLVHANGIKAAILGISVARKLGVPLLWMKHDHMYDGWVARQVARRCDAVVVVSEAMGEQFKSRVRTPVQVIYPGVQIGPPPGPPPAEKLVVSVGRLDPLKGFPTLLESLVVLRSRGIDARMQIAGPVDRIYPEHAGELQELVSRLGLDDVAKVGWVDDLDDLYRHGRVFAMASPPKRGGKPSEGAPTVLMEAMSHGRPVLGPRQAGIAEVIGPDAGTLVDDLTPEGFADAISPYLEDVELATETGRRGRERAERVFSMERTVEQLTGLWAELAARGRADAR